jgi:hypothetical protein
LQPDYEATPSHPTLREKVKENSRGKQVYRGKEIREGIGNVSRPVGESSPQKGEAKHLRGKRW